MGNLLRTLLGDLFSTLLGDLLRTLLGVRLKPEGFEFDFNRGLLGDFLKDMLSKVYFILVWLLLDVGFEEERSLVLTSRTANLYILLFSCRAWLTYFFILKI